jgi:hypothetical protein
MSSLIRRPSCQSCRRRAELQAETIRAVSRRAGRRGAELQTEAIRAVSRRVRRRRAELQAEAIRAGSRRVCRRRSVAQSVGHAVKHAVAEPNNKPNNELSQAGNCEHEQSIMQAVAQAIPPTGHQSEYRSGCRAEYRTETLMIIRCEYCLQAVKNIAANIHRRGWLLTLM